MWTCLDVIAAVLNSPTNSKVWHATHTQIVTMQRIATIARHLGSNSQSLRPEAQPTAATRSTENDDDVVIVSALRTPVCKAARGQLKVRI